MARIGWLCPGTWERLYHALADAGHDVVDLWAAAAALPATEMVLDVQRRMLAAALVDATKLVRCLDDSADALAAWDAVASGLAYQTVAPWLVVLALGEMQASHAGALDAVLVGCTFDPFGRAVAAACREHRLPLLHIQHSCMSGAAEDYWYAAETPGDWLLLPGERDRAWWQRCAPQMAASGRVVVTGYPGWDEYAAMSGSRP